MYIINRVFESFSEFNNEYESINEAKSGLTLDNILEFIEILIDKQRKLAEESKTARKSFSEHPNNISKGFDLYIKNLGEIKSRSTEEYLTYLTSREGRGTYKGISARYAAYAWENVTDDEKRILAIKLLAQARKKGYKTSRELEKLVKDKNEIGKRPYIGLMPESLKKKPREIPEIVTEVQLMNEGEESGLFKDNMYKMEDSSFISEEIKDNLIEKITYFLNEILLGELKLDSIDIISSASRYRNTGDDEEVISWGELSFQRTFTLAKIIFELAKGMGLNDAEIEKLRLKTSLDFYGSNGDGTSGPNPPEGIRFGYYDKDNKFVRGNKRNEIVIYSLNEEGKPETEKEIIEIDPLEDSSDYDQFRYVNIIIKGRSIDIKEEKEPDSSTDIEGHQIMGVIPAKDDGKKLKTPKVNKPTQRATKRPWIKKSGCPKPL